MAQAIAQKIEIPQPPIIKDGVVLHLTTAEAQVLMFVLGRVGGSYDTPRGVSEGVYTALGTVGIRMPEFKTTERGGVHFV